MIRISDAILKITQDRDTCDDGPEVQTLRIFTDDGGGGPFLVLSSDRWALEWHEVPRLAIAALLVYVLAMVGGSK